MKSRLNIFNKKEIKYCEKLQVFSNLYIISINIKGEIMKALIVNKEKELKLVDMKAPESNGKEVIAKVLTCGICGSDIHYWDIGQPSGIVLGHEYCCSVVDPGERKDLKKGDRITALPISPCLKCDACRSGNIHYCAHTWEDATGTSLSRTGAYAEYIKLRPDMVRKVPDSMTDEQVAMVEPSAVGLHAVHLGEVKVGDKVLIIGGGIIGLMSAEFSKLQGASYVAMTETNPARGKSAVKLKAVDECFDALQKDVIEKLGKASNGGFDVVIDCCGNSPAVTTALQAVKEGGRVVLVGVSLQPISIPTALIVLRELKVLGDIAYTEKEFDSCIELIANKKINVDKYISKIVGLDEGQQSFETLTSGKDSAIKIILRPDLKSKCKKQNSKAKVEVKNEKSVSEVLSAKNKTTSRKIVDKNQTKSKKNTKKTTTGTKKSAKGTKKA